MTPPVPLPPVAPEVLPPEPLPVAPPVPTAPPVAPDFPPVPPAGRAGRARNAQESGCGKGQGAKRLPRHNHSSCRVLLGGCHRVLKRVLLGPVPLGAGRSAARNREGSRAGAVTVGVPRAVSRFRLRAPFRVALGSVSSSRWSVFPPPAVAAARRHFSSEQLPPEKQHRV
jgi:hypothetical protein